METVEQQSFSVNQRSAALNLLSNTRVVTCGCVLRLSAEPNNVDYLTLSLLVSLREIEESSQNR
jgi:hypothetical protein